MTSIQQSSSLPLEPSSSNVVLSTKTNAKNVISRTGPESQKDYANRWFRASARHCEESYPKFAMGVEFQSQAFYLVVNDQKIKISDSWQDHVTIL